MRKNCHFMCKPTLTKSAFGLTKALEAKNMQFRGTSWNVLFYPPEWNPFGPGFGFFSA